MWCSFKRETSTPNKCKHEKRERINDCDLPPIIDALYQTSKTNCFRLCLPIGRAAYENIASDIHTVNTHIKFDVEEGQRLLCKGRVHSGRFVTEDGNNRLRLINSSYFTRPVHQNCTDINFVEMYGNIASNVFKRLASTHFTLVSHLRPK